MCLAWIWCAYLVDHWSLKLIRFCSFVVITYRCKKISILDTFDYLKIYLKLLWELLYLANYYNQGIEGVGKFLLGFLGAIHCYNSVCLSFGSLLALMLYAQCLFDDKILISLWVYGFWSNFYLNRFIWLRERNRNYKYGLASCLTESLLPGPSSHYLIVDLALLLVGLIPLAAPFLQPFQVLVIKRVLWSQLLRSHRMESLDIQVETLSLLKCLI